MIHEMADGNGDGISEGLLIDNQDLAKLFESNTTISWWAGNNTAESVASQLQAAGVPELTELDNGYKIKTHDNDLPTANINGIISENLHFENTNVVLTGDVQVSGKITFGDNVFVDGQGYELYAYQGAIIEAISSTQIHQIIQLLAIQKLDI